MIKFASRMDNIKGSEIRELLKLTQQPDIISFAGGLPAPELFPIEQMKAASQTVLDENGQSALQYSTTEGYLPLREYIVNRMAQKYDVNTTVDNIMITNGSQQGLDFAGRVFLDEGDVVLLESPSYLGAINAFKINGPRFIEVPTDNDGMIMSELEKILEKEDRVKLIYVIPDFQNPSGRSWTMERRLEFMKIINKYEIPTIEDNPYGELRFEGEKLPSLKSLDTKELIIFLGSFSKILAPGYRLGWACASELILSKFNTIAQASTLQASTIGQMETYKFLEQNDLDEHVNKIIDVYKGRRDLMLETMAKEFPEGVEFTHPTGGLFTWVILPDYIDAAEMAKECLAEKVAYVPGGSFFPNGGNKNTFRLNYSCMPEEKIVEGITRLGKVIKNNMK